MIAASDVYFRHIEFFPRAEESSTTLEKFPSSIDLLTYCSIYVFLWGFREILRKSLACMMPIGSKWEMDGISAFLAILTQACYTKVPSKNLSPAFFL